MVTALEPLSAGSVRGETLGRLGRWAFVEEVLGNLACLPVAVGEQAPKRFFCLGILERGERHRSAAPHRCLVGGCRNDGRKPAHVAHSTECRNGGLSDERFLVGTGEFNKPVQRFVVGDLVLTHGPAGHLEYFPGGIVQGREERDLDKGGCKFRCPATHRDIGFVCSKQEAGERVGGHCPESHECPKRCASDTCIVVCTACLCESEVTGVTRHDDGATNRSSVAGQFGHFRRPVRVLMNQIAPAARTRATNAATSTLSAAPAVSEAIRRNQLGLTYNATGRRSVSCGVSIRGWSQGRSPGNFSHARRVKVPVALTGFTRPIATSSAMATATVHPDRTVRICSRMLDDNTQSPMVPTPPTAPASDGSYGAAASDAFSGSLPPDEPVRLPSRKHRWWGVPLALIGVAVPVAALVTNGIRVDHWAFAPGAASPVGTRLTFDDLPQAVVEDDSPGQFLFVTVSGAHLNVLQYGLGRGDDDVRILSREQRFGKADPSQERQIDLQMMRDAKEVAEYVAYQRLGFDAKLKAGAVVVEQVLCLNGEMSNSKACDTKAPAAEYLERGATITEINGTPTPTVDELGPVMAKVKPGDKVTVKYRTAHGEDEKSATFATIASKESDGRPSRALIGFVAHDTYSVELPFRANIDTDAIGGPSAGLAFTLTLIDRLSPGALTGDQRIAVTGTIETDGSVGAIGGLRQKVAAVRRAGAAFFIVPKAQGEDGDDGLAEARTAAGPNLEIVPVANLDEALRALAERGGTPLPERSKQ